jgi:anti-anti-sigma factor
MTHDSVQIDLADEESEGRRATVHGALDVFSSATLARRVFAGLPERTHEIVVDLRDVSFVDSAGVSALVRLRQQGAGRAVEVRACLGDAQHRINSTVVELLRRVLPCVD